MTAVVQALRLNHPSDYKHNFHYPKLKAYLRRLRISYSYIKNSQGKNVTRTRSITAVGNKTPEQVTFDFEDPSTGRTTKMSVAQYFQRRSYPRTKAYVLC